MKYRIIIYGTLAVLVVLLIILGARLPRDIRTLMTADGYSARWGVIQTETEFANLAALLAEERLSEEPNSQSIRLRTDITLSRANLITSGQSRSIWTSSSEASAILDKLESYIAKASEIIDQPGPLQHDSVEALLMLTNAVRPDVRRLTNLGIAFDTEVRNAQRADFANKLLRFEYGAIALIVLLAVALLYLDRLLASARAKDKALSASAERLSSTVEASLDGIVITNSIGEIIEFNSAAEEIFGWKEHEITGANMIQTVFANSPEKSGDQAATGKNAFRQLGLINSGRTELRGLRRTGEEFPIEINITSAKQDQEELYIAYVRDISERVINETKLISARDIAERTDHAKSQFLAVMSHEMRTPLNGLIGVLDLLRTTKLDERQERFVQVASASGEVLLERVNEALDITRIESGVTTLTPEVFSLRAVVTRVVDVLRTLAAEKGLTIDIDFDPSMNLQFVADGGRINQILTNLIGNAVKFTETGGVRVGVTGVHGADHTVATIAISDTGPGVPEESLEEIFEDFVALAKSTGRQGRSDGLGLGISRKVARLMGGDLTVSSEIGEGSTFTISLPLERAAPAAIATRENAMRKPEIQRNVLIVEDNAINRSVLREMLLGLGHAVTEAENGQIGLEQATETAFDVIIMDITMPVMDGIEAVSKIRSGSGPNRDTYVLGLTAHGRQEFRDKAKEAGMDRFFTKPIRLADLPSILEGQHHSKPNEMPTDVLQTEVLGDLRKALGLGATIETLEKFSSELSAEVSRMQDLTADKLGTKISETLHNLRGAAVMLGMPQIATELDQANALNKAGDLEGFQDRLQQLQSVSNSACSEAIDWLSSAKS